MNVLGFQREHVPRIINNPHFWIIAVLFVCLLVFYYVYLAFPIDQRFVSLRLYAIFEYRNKLNGWLFILPFLYATLAFWWRGALISWSLAMLAMIPRLLSLYISPLYLATNIFYAAFPVVLISLVILEINWRHKERNLLAEREAERQSYIAQIFNAEEDERRRIAQELHDDTTQTLMVVANDVRALKDEKLSPSSNERITWINDTVLRLADDMRRLSHDLRPSVLDTMGLIPALRWFLDQLEHDSSIRSRLICRGTIQALKSEREVGIFRIVQEALNNVRKHAEATVVSITLIYSPATLKIRIRDNGKGFVVPKSVIDLTSKGKWGLRGMKQRTETLGGSFKIRSSPGRGTIITAEFPHQMGNSFQGNKQRGPKD